MAMLNPIVDPEQERITDQLAQAAALRKQAFANNTGGGYQGGKIFMVGSPVGNILQGIAGNILERRARGEQTALENARLQERQSWLDQLPKGYTENTETVLNGGQPLEAPAGQQVPPAGNLATGVTDPRFLNQDFTQPGVPTGEPQPATFNGESPLAASIGAAPRQTTTTQTPVSPLQQAKAMQEWAMKAPRGMEGVQQFALQQALTAPQREAEAAQKAADRLHELKLKAIDARATQAERLEAQKEIARMNIEGRQDLARLAASLKASNGGGSKADMRIIDTVDEDGNPVKKVIDLNALNVGATFGKPAKPPTKEEIAQGKLEAAPGRIDQILDDAAKNEKAFGIIPAASNLLPDIVGSRVRDKALTEDQQKARMKVQTQGAKIIHDIYGAALSRGEAFRANAWAPNPMDSYETTMTKLKAAKDYAAIIAGEGTPSKKPGASKTPAGGMSDDDLLKKYGAGK